MLPRRCSALLTFECLVDLGDMSFWLQVCTICTAGRTSFLWLVWGGWSCSWGPPQKSPSEGQGLLSPALLRKGRIFLSRGAASQVTRQQEPPGCKPVVQAAPGQNMSVGANLGPAASWSSAEMWWHHEGDTGWSPGFTCHHHLLGHAVPQCHPILCLKLVSSAGDKRLHASNVKA